MFTGWDWKKSQRSGRGSFWLRLRSMCVPEAYGGCLGEAVKLNNQEATGLRLFVSYEFLGNKLELNLGGFLLFCFSSK